MAVAGIQSVEVRGSPILEDSRLLESGFHGDQGRSGTRAFSILQMWRELEDEYVVSCSHGRAGSRLLGHNNNGLSTHPAGTNMCQSQEGEGMDGFEDSSESDNGDGSAFDAHLGPQSEHEDHQSITSEQSHDLGELERKRVRKIFRGWMNNGLTGHRPNGTSRNSSSKGQWLGEREIERVRVVREWIQMTTQHGDAVGGNKDDQAGEIGIQIKRVRDGLILDHNQGQIESPSRGILRFCGRQALLDLLAKRAREVQRELKVLVECRAVTSFPFRNRIQSSLRVRFLLNKPLIEDDRLNSAAESELGLLRQRSTVSDLRDSFLSKLVDTVQVNASDHLDISYDCCSDGFKDEETQADCSTEDCVGSNDQSSSVNHQINTGTLPCYTTGAGGSSPEERNLQEPGSIRVGTRPEHASDDVNIALSHSSDSPHRPADTGCFCFGGAAFSSDVCINTNQNFNFVSHHEFSASTSLIYALDLVPSVSEERNLLVSFDLQGETELKPAFDSGERDADEEKILTGSVDMQEEIGLEHAFSSDEGNQVESNYNELASSDVEDRWQMVYHSGFEGVESSQLEGDHVVVPEQCDLDRDEHNAHFMPYQSDSFHGSTEQIQDQDSPTVTEDRQEQVPGDGESTSGSSVISNIWGNLAQEEMDWRVEGWQGQVTEDAERDSEGSVLSNVWGNDYREEMNGIYLAGSDNEMLHDNLAHQVENHVAASSWHVNASVEETPGDGLEETSVERDVAGYYTDDDHTYHTELRELLSRRRVSSLLHSGFREHLNQLIQSYVERQTQSVNDWDVQEMPLPADRENQQLPRIDLNEETSVSEELSFIQQPYTTGSPNNSTWSRHHHIAQAHRPGTELEMINDLRIDMARLQQRLNTMQRMLDTCMDMQAELQRAVRQEVSAALNRSTHPSGTVGDPLIEDRSNWDYVRKGVCCLCYDTKIDSLLYRCGHMCTCTECASMLVTGSGKCPMCRAPVLEVIRAYVIQ